MAIIRTLADIVLALIMIFVVWTSYGFALKSRGITLTTFGAVMASFVLPLVGLVVVGTDRLKRTYDRTE